MSLLGITQHITAQRFLNTAWTRYQTLLRSRPYLSNSLTAAGLMLVGDILAQHLDKRAHDEVKRYDPKRTLAMVVSTALLMPPYVPLMRYLDRAFAATFSGAIKKSVFNAATAGVLSNAWMIFSSTFIDALLRGETATVAKRLGRTALARKILGVAGSSAGFWVPVNTMTFWMVPPYLRLVVNSACGCAWSCILSSLWPGEIARSSIDQPDVER
ncbi:Protein Mpv17 [Perkinsus olseni]|uniref:Protein Mpv17 n=1 Tax=Perkinsus olseni TaxID=32597 RepID=A0A7J6MA29_PEROL|nr:Protein Mpv17 [Perkinsus olseni]KAF4673727.1 Protein Mpv17 [Perkinsus olseni]